MKLFPVYALNDITVVRAEGSRVYDDQGKAYLDFYGGHAVISIGHRHPHWVKRIEDQLHKIAFYSNSIKLPIQNEFAETLGRVSGKTSDQLFLCNSGAEANENAFKLASFHTKRKKIVAFQKSFHGRTSLAVAATDNPIDRLASLAEAHVPIYHIHGDCDTVVPLEENSGKLAQRYRQLGGEITLNVVKGQGHNMWPGWFQSQELVDFVIAQAHKR